MAAFHEAEAGIKYARNSKPNLILMDVMLPGLSGAEAVKILKSDPQLKSIPVIFLTALVSGQDEGLKGINVSGLHYQTLGKPYEIEELLKLVKDVLDRG